MKVAIIFPLAAVALLVLGTVSCICADKRRGRGNVADAQGAMVPGATVTLISESRGTTQDTQSTATGDFTFPSVLPDTYTVRVTMEGFKTLEAQCLA